MQLTRRSLALLLVTSVLIALSALGTAFAWLAIAWLVVVAALLLADWRLMPRPRDWELARRHDDRLSLAAPNRIEVAVRLFRPGRAPLVWLRDNPPVGFAIADEERVLHGHVPPGEAAVFAYHVRPPRRGDYRFGDLHLRWESPLGLLRRQARFPAAESVKVYPNLVDVRKYDLLLRRNALWELGLRARRTPGSGSEYERLRDYQPDDEYRRINWKATARRGKPISVEYEAERSQNIVVLLDVGRMMRGPVGDVAKMDFAINAVLLLTYVAAQKGDKVGLLAFADKPLVWVSPHSGRAQFHRMLEQLYAVEGQPVEPDYGAAFTYFATKQMRRSLAIVFSDLTGSISSEALVRQMIRLRQRHLPLLVTVGDPGVQALAAQPISGSAALYERTVAQQILDERRLALDRLRGAGVLTLDAPADELSVAVINRYLEIKERTLI